LKVVEEQNVDALPPMLKLPVGLLQALSTVKPYCIVPLNGISVGVGVGVGVGGTQVEQT
jgi:hypothetical protein